MKTSVPGPIRSRTGRPAGEVARRASRSRTLPYDELFDRAYRRLCDRDIEHWADPQTRRPGEINDEHGGRGVYFEDPAGHAIELIIRPYP